jgi:hypothetical protein
LTEAQERAIDVSDSEESIESSNGDIGADIEKLDHKVDLLAQANAILEEERDGLIVEKACVNISMFVIFRLTCLCKLFLRVIITMHYLYALSDKCMFTNCLLHASVI